MKLPFWATILTTLGLMVLCSLGGWQVKRLAWKTEVLKSVAAEYAVDAISRPLSLQDIMDEGVYFKRGALTGHYLHDDSILIQPRTYDGANGYHVLTPFVISDGLIVLVNRGWIPIDREIPDGAVIERPEGKITITGMVRPVPKENAFTLQNSPEKDIWHSIDISQISLAKGLSHIAPNIFYVESEPVLEGENQEGRYPISAATQIKPNNNHAQYALFWFSMAFLLVVIYVLRFMIPLKKENNSFVDESN